MPDLPAIITSNSAYGTHLTCNRKRYLAYEAPTGFGMYRCEITAGGCGNTSLHDLHNIQPCPSCGKNCLTWFEASRGWERQRMSLPLSTGGWCHRVAQGLFLIEADNRTFDGERPVTGLSMRGLRGPLVDWWKALGVDPPERPMNASQVISASVRGYQQEARERGLDLGLQMDGSLPEEKFVERTIEEQSALLEAFGWAFLRVRLPRLLEEYELVDVEREEYTLLSGDVGLQSRCDAVLRRKPDSRLFIYNLKTSGNPDKRWKDSFEVDAQLMTETLAVERRLGERVYGVIIDGFDKGMRVELDFTTFKERPKDGVEKWYGQRSRLIYGYKCEDIPGRPTLYDFEGTTRKGWGKFAVWQESFPQTLDGRQYSPIAYWANWLPVEQVEAAFITLPPIMRSDRAVESAVRQIVNVEQEIRGKRTIVEDLARAGTQAHAEYLDANFPQSFKSCIYPSRCSYFEICHGSAGDDPQSNGFQPRTSNHPALEGGE